jgi:hypothetical protein
MKFESIIKTWNVLHHRTEVCVELMHDFTIRTSGKYGERLLNPNVFIGQWFGFTTDKQKEIDIVIEILSVMPVQMMSPETKNVANFYANYSSDEVWTNVNLRPDQEFFTGPRIHSLGLVERKTILQMYCEKTHSFFQMTDGFRLFDYNEIQFFKEVRNDSGGEDYFRIENGKVSYGGYDNTGNGGEQSWDLESVYYWPKDLFNLLTNHRFETTQEEVKEIMDKYILTN